MFSGKLPYIGLGLLFVIIGIPVMYFLFTMGGDLAGLLGHESKDTKIERLSTSNNNLKQSLENSKHMSAINEKINENEQEAITGSLKDRVKIKDTLVKVNEDYNTRLNEILENTKKRLLKNDIKPIERKTYADLKIDEHKTTYKKILTKKKQVITVKVIEKPIKAKVITIDAVTYQEVGEASIDAIYAAYDSVKKIGVENEKNS